MEVNKNYKQKYTYMCFVQHEKSFPIIEYRHIKMDLHQYVYYQSSHQEHIKKLIAYSQFD